MPNPIDNMFASSFAASPFATETVTVCADDKASSGGMSRNQVRVSISGASVQVQRNAGICHLKCIERKGS